jgi:hypothetical protein
MPSDNREGYAELDEETLQLVGEGYKKVSHKTITKKIILNIEEGPPNVYNMLRYSWQKTQSKL